MTPEEYVDDLEKALEIWPNESDFSSWKTQGQRPTVHAQRLLDAWTVRENELQARQAYLASIPKGYREVTMSNTYLPDKENDREHFRLKQFVREEEEIVDVTILVRNKFTGQKYKIKYGREYTKDALNELIAERRRIR